MKIVPAGAGKAYQDSQLLSAEKIRNKDESENGIGRVVCREVLVYNSAKRKCRNKEDRINKKSDN